jgi:hypothetical protein
MTNDALYTALLSLIAICGLLYLVFWLFRSYVLDKFRQDVFSLRDELFDEASRGAIRFDDPAYVILRTTMNGFIRYAHRLDFWNAVILITVEKRRRDLGAEPFEAAYQRAMQGLSESQVEMINKYYNRMNTTIVRFLVNSNPEAFPVLFAVLVYLTIYVAMHMGAHVVRSNYSQGVAALPAIIKQIAPLNDAAYAYGQVA